MNELKQLIEVLTDEEADAFIAFAKAKNKRNDVKNILLFQWLRAGKTKDLSKELYGVNKSGALYALQSRLKENLMEFMESKIYEKQPDQRLTRELAVAQRLLQRGKYKLGHKILQKTIDSATGTESHASILQLFQTKINYIDQGAQQDLDQLLWQMEQAQKNYQLEIDLVKVCALINRELTASPKQAPQIIEKYLERSHLLPNPNWSFTAMHRLLETITEAAVISSNFSFIAKWLEELNQLLAMKKTVADQHPVPYLEILYLLAGSFMRVRDFNACGNLLEEMELAMESFGKSFVKQYREPWMVLKALHLNYTGNALQAIALIDQEHHSNRRLHLLLVTFHFQQENFQLSRRLLRDFNHSDQFYVHREGVVWMIKKYLLEIMVFMELGLPDLTDSRLRSFKGFLKKHEHAIAEDRIPDFVKVLVTYNQQPDQLREAAYQQKIQQLMMKQDLWREDLFSISFYAFLKARMEKKSIYQATLELIDPDV
ncbi:hypothetical protein [Nonlabens xiamenensis]|uniref:hypothetical protein n=1 Tax=Nonlabens xiamenensis TaxID=2341043 RepID=UPI000F612019|nr:hypothetical protein [Nonlabens xiamenensis]